MIPRESGSVADPARVYVFDALAAAVQAAALAAPGVTITPRHPDAMISVRGDARDAAFVYTASAAFGVHLPLVPNTTSGSEGMRALWLGPDEWLIVFENRGQTPFSSGESGNTEKGVCPLFVDVSHARALLRLSGSATRAVLAKVCPLDLDPRQFPVGACAQTAIAKVNAILDHVEPDAFDLYCSRSYARSFWHAITEAAAEYGCNNARPS